MFVTLNSTLLEMTVILHMSVCLMGKLFWRTPTPVQTDKQTQTHTIKTLLSTYTCKTGNY